MSALARREEVRKVACKIFHEAYFPTLQKRTGQALLSEPLYGPKLKSHWPLRLRELTSFWRNPFSTEIPLPNATKYASKVAYAHSSLPYPLSRVYRLFISEWRHNRGKNVKKGKEDFYKYFPLNTNFRCFKSYKHKSWKSWKKINLQYLLWTYLLFAYSNSISPNHHSILPSSSRASTKTGPY